ncbi:hypothetical protein MalM14_44810 [Gimesia chilikensis]|nr:hypothetical protein MalM14_44810 [Gimesia chilikensis]
MVPENYAGIAVLQNCSSGHMNWLPGARHNYLKQSAEWHTVKKHGFRSVFR